MKKLTDIGFKKVGKWSFENNLLQYKLNENYTTKNILYSFVIENEIKYIGKSVRTISQRLNGYRRPNISQQTNFRLKNLIIEKIREGKEVEIYLFEDNSELSYKGNKINLSAGLEDNLIAKFLPEWNLIGKSGKLKEIKSVVKIENDEKIMEKKYKEEIIDTIAKGFESIDGLDGDISWTEKKEGTASFAKLLQDIPLKTKLTE